MAASPSQTTPRIPSGRFASVALVGASLLEVLALTQHPHVHAHSMAQAIEQLAALAASFARVHALVIAVLLVSFIGLAEFARRRDLARPLIQAALTAYGAGVLAMIAGALVEGIVTPRIAAHALTLGAADTQTTAQLVNFCMQFNQAFAGFGVVSMATGIGLWSLDLIRAPGAAKALGVLGLAGMVGGVGLLAGVLPLEGHGLIAVLGVQIAWSAGIGLLLWRGGSGASGPQFAYQPMP
ncbi:MAG TPA: hypothetical protein VEY89_09000 [Candidatus Dormibacteraeota bacterium]|nr:hypothetical protein [Candidatus Dormibacteraeota bacterium]